MTQNHVTHDTIFIAVIELILKLHTVGADKNGTPVFVHFSAQAASNSNISEAIM